MFILHAHAKSINATVMGTQILVGGEVEQHLGPERRSGSRTVSGMKTHIKPSETVATLKTGWYI